MRQTNIKRNDIFWVDLDPAKDTEIQKTRPCVIISSDLMNDNFTRIIVAPITSNIKKVYLFDFLLDENCPVKGKVLLHQIRSVDKTRLGKKIGSLSLKDMNDIDKILESILELR